MKSLIITQPIIWESKHISTSEFSWSPWSINMTDHNLSINIRNPYISALIFPISQPKLCYIIGGWYHWSCIKYWTTYRFCLRSTCSSRRSWRPTICSILRFFPARFSRAILRNIRSFFWSPWRLRVYTSMWRSTSWSLFFCRWTKCGRTLSRRFRKSRCVTWPSRICT